MTDSNCRIVSFSSGKTTCRGNGLCRPDQTRIRKLRKACYRTIPFSLSDVVKTVGIYQLLGSPIVASPFHTISLFAIVIERIIYLKDSEIFLGFDKNEETTYNTAP